MQHWLLKVEPSVYSLDMLKKDKVTTWDGVKNRQAQKYLKTMKISDLAFYYHTEKEKAVVGIVRVHKEYYHSSDPEFGVVDIEYVKPLKSKVTLYAMKQNAALQKLPILRQPRLSVSPVSQEEWDAILNLSESSVLCLPLFDQCLYSQLHDL